MPGIIQTSPSFKTISIKELHPTFGAEVEGVDWQNMTDEQFDEIVEAMAKYGVCVFRKTNLTDEGHIAFSQRFGELDNIRRFLTNGRVPRFKYYELFDAGNVDQDGSVLDPNSARAQYNKGNGLFHVDSSYNPRRASYCMLLAHEIPPPGNGGQTEFADTRTAFEELPSDLKEELLREDYVAAHTLSHSRKTAAPEFFKDLDPWQSKMYRHKIAQRHTPSDRMNLYIAAHAHHIEDVPADKSEQLLSSLMTHATQKKYVMGVDWLNSSDMVMWDNRCVMHRACGGAFAGKYKRDLRRTTVHDDSPTAWGLQSKDDLAEGFNVDQK